ncbi:MAG: hypothetical protein HY287_13800 [Planctomycetes bacterium]|nr:hypothetical protein [Planctomycetota bacterium]MBI3835397.1 hypothetical protein [Planctomycetota bacterium]
MKAGIRFGGWRPVLGVVVVGALACSVGVQGGPRVTDDVASRTKGKAASDATRLVTGDPAHLNSVVAGVPLGQTLKFYFTPRAALGGTSTGAYPAGATVVGQVLTVSGGGFNSAWITQLEGWDPGGTGDPLLRSFQDKIDATGFMGANAAPANAGCDLAYPAATFACQKTCAGGANVGLPCTTNGNCPGSTCADPCPALMGESGTKCGGTVALECDWGWQSTTRADWVFAANAPSDQTPVAAIISPTGPNFAGTVNPGTEIFDSGGKFYTGTLVLPVPACCKGTYTIGHKIDETFAQDQDQPANNILVAAYVAGQLTCQIGSCCTASQCIDGLTLGECVAAGGSAQQYTAGGHCLNPPTTDGCAECPSGPGAAGNAECEAREAPADACITSTCNATLHCDHNPKAGWNQGTQCCDSNTGTVTTPGGCNQCQTAGCTIAPNHGSAVCSNNPAGSSCDDGNPCTGTPNTAADSCDGNGACTGVADPNCVLTPCLTFDLDPSPKEEANCYDSGKITGTAHVGQMTGTVTGGQVRITYDPTCLSFNDITGVSPFDRTVFGPVVDEAAGTIFIAVSINFGATGQTGGNFDLLAFSFDKIGNCNSCNLCWNSINPQNSYLVDNFGQKVSFNTECPGGTCSGAIRANNKLAITVPNNIKTNVDCDHNTAVEHWTAPSVTDSCGTATLFCRGEHESGLQWSNGVVQTGGEFPIGVSNFCCYAVSNYCGKRAGCEPGTDCQMGSDGRPIGCWTVDVNDETSLDVEIGLGPNSQGTKVADGLTRCIKFSLYTSSVQAPTYFEEDVTFGGLFEFIGKFTGKIKLGGAGQWDCITAWDQLHTLRSCYRINPSDCVDGVLHAHFSGDPAFGGNWLIGGNLDGYRKQPGDPVGSQEYTIDIIDWGILVSQYGQNMDPNTPCGTAGPHADINGDGTVGLEDVAYVQNNFLVSSKSCCGAAFLPADIQGRTSITVNELRQMGMGDLAVADLNGDGVLNVDDMTLFMQGARAGTKVNNGRSGTR